MLLLVRASRGKLLYFSREQSGGIAAGPTGASCQTQIDDGSESTTWVATLAQSLDMILRREAHFAGRIPPRNRLQVKMGYFYFAAALRFSVLACFDARSFLFEFVINKYHN